MIMGIHLSKNMATLCIMISLYCGHGIITTQEFTQVLIQMIAKELLRQFQQLLMPFAIIAFTTLQMILVGITVPILFRFIPLLLFRGPLPLLKGKQLLRQEEILLPIQQ